MNKKEIANQLALQMAEQRRQQVPQMEPQPTGEEDEVTDEWELLVQTVGLIQMNATNKAKRIRELETEQQMLSQKVSQLATDLQVMRKRQQVIILIVVWVKVTLGILLFRAYK